MAKHACATDYRGMRGCYESVGLSCYRSRVVFASLWKDDLRYSSQRQIVWKRNVGHCAEIRPTTLNLRFDLHLGAGRTYPSSMCRITDAFHTKSPATCVHRLYRDKRAGICGFIHTRRKSATGRIPGFVNRLGREAVFLSLVVLMLASSRVISPEEETHDSVSYF